jgi:hypothetical protein
MVQQPLNVACSDSSSQVLWEDGERVFSRGWRLDDNGNHPLMRKLDAIKAAGGQVVEIKLSPLAQEHLGQLVAEALRCEFERAAPLAKVHFRMAAPGNRSEREHAGACHPGTK